MAETWLPKVDLSHLSAERPGKVESVLREECDVFSKCESDIGNIREFEMKINLADKLLVKEPYRHIPRNLYVEVKNYISDLLVNGWVRESCSAYASPIVCVSNLVFHTRYVKSLSPRLYFRGISTRDSIFYSLGS